MKHRADNIDEFETAGPFETARVAVALRPKSHGKYQEPSRMLLRCKRLFTSRIADRGASMVEYALLLILIAIVAFVAVSIAGQNVSKAFSTVADGFVNPN